MAYTAATKRETVVSARTSATSGTATVATVLTVGGESLTEFDELIVYVVSSQNLAGTTPTMNLYLQRAIRPAADPAVDGDWTDFLSFSQVTVGIDRYMIVSANQAAASASAIVYSGAGRSREETDLPADNAVIGHWGDKIRIREEMGGTVTTPSIYSIHITGRINS